MTLPVCSHVYIFAGNLKYYKKYVLMEKSSKNRKDWSEQTVYLLSNASISQYSVFIESLINVRMCNNRMKPTLNRSF